MARRHVTPEASSAARSPVDWTALRRRIDAAGASIATATRSPEDARALLDARARQLARVDASSAQESVDVITFRLAKETYTVATAWVSGVFPLHAITPVPGAGELVLGITEWRGDLLTLIDLRRLLGLPLTKLDDLGMAIVLGADQPAFGILADAVTGLATVVTSELHAPKRGTPYSSSHVRGLTGDAVIMLDAESLLKSSITRSD